MPPAPTLRERLHRAALVGYRYAPLAVRRIAIRLLSPSHSAGATIALRRPDGRVLMVEQRHTGAWALPGGLVRRRELPPDTAARELAEEVGILIDPAELGDSHVVFDPNRRHVDFVFVHAADARIARRADTAEVTRLGWYDPAAPPPLTEPTVAMLRAAGLIGPAAG